jgi:hypothetical protein
MDYFGNTYFDGVTTWRSADGTLEGKKGDFTAASGSYWELTRIKPKPSSPTTTGTLAQARGDTCKEMKPFGLGDSFARTLTPSVRNLYTKVGPSGAAQTAEAWNNAHHDVLAVAKTTENFGCLAHYHLVESGTCMEHGLTPVTDATECVIAMHSFGLSLHRSSATVKPFDHQNPTGCVRRRDRGRGNEIELYQQYTGKSTKGNDASECGAFLGVCKNEIGRASCRERVY